MHGLLEYLRKNQSIQSDGILTICDSFLSPGYLTALAAYCKSNQIEFSKLTFSNIDTQSYVSAIGLEPVLGGTDSYPYARKNSGVNYSQLVLLNSVDDTDKATSAINGCIRDIFQNENNKKFINELCAVVGDLHDNVWSHGKSTGISMAQKWKKQNSNNEFLFEFALADCGLGFLAELKRVGLSINNDKDAIEWCIVKGNSSKNLKKPDEWSQRLPLDISDNPIPGIGKAVISENHHMGLGLAKLIKLVSDYKGQLWLSSGLNTLHISVDGSKKFFSHNTWKGVALACQFDTECTKCYIKSDENEITGSLIELLRT